MSNVNRPVTPSAAAHAQRIRERESGEQKPPAAGQSTPELYAQRILPSYKRDEELREQARLNELRARGQWVPGDQEDDDLEDDQEQEEPAAAVDPTDNPERRSARAAWRSARFGGGFLAL
ncbi:hypothetical protein GT030_29620 [Streptomyces sp. SID1328]|uniref:hypothetical protein n=1 Tax=Streptomyces sp. SID1328 TaxID=2690250 RepID=UPI00136A6148|nr:hypothetical protein [Streptomyces sp. SID1328]MYV42913.1 hypothetical protein [Streptomyces sp. SID1328]